MTPKELARSIPGKELQVMVREVLLWRSKTILSGDALRGFARRLELEAGISTDDTLQIAEDLIIAEAARRFAEQPGETA